MKIEVKLFAQFRDFLPKGSDRFSCTLTLDSSKSVGDILRRLKLPPDSPKIILLNGRHAKENDPIKDGDVLSVFPPVAGG
jgi:molybdopterin synthase sulfur carrier subunit